MPVAESTPQTLYDKVFQAHIVDEKLDGTILLYIDRHLVHEVTSPVGVPILKHMLWSRGIDALGRHLIASF